MLQYLRSSVWWMASVAWQAPSVFYGVYWKVCSHPPRSLYSNVIYHPLILIYTVFFFLFFLLGEQRLHERLPPRRHACLLRYDILATLANIRAIILSMPFCHSCYLSTVSIACLSVFVFV